MNPFLDKLLYNFPQIDENKSKEMRVRQEEFLSDKDFTVDDVVELLIKFDKDGQYTTPSKAAGPLYYFSRMDKVAKVLGYKATSDYILGTFSDDFYKKLLAKLSDDAKKRIFSWIPGKLQDEKLILNYFTENQDANFSNYKGKKPSEKLLLDLLDINFGAVVRSIKENWWTKKIKDKVLAKDKVGLVFMSPKVIDRDEIIDFIRTNVDAERMYNIMFRSNGMAEEFQKDQEIRAEFAILKKSTKDISRDFFSDCDYDFFKHYLEKIKPSNNNRSFYQMIPTQMVDDTLKDLLIDKLPFEALIHLSDLDKTQLKALYNNAKKIRVGVRSAVVKFVFEMKKNDLFEIGMLEDFDKITFNDLENTLSDTDMKKMMTPDVVDYYFDEEDDDFFKTKGSMKYAGELDAKKFFVLLKNLSYAKLKTRINFRFSEDDFAYVFLRLRSGQDNIDKKVSLHMAENIQKLIKDGYIDVTEQLVTELGELPPETTYDGYLNAKDIFMF